MKKLISYTLHTLIVFFFLSLISLAEAYSSEWRIKVHDSIVVENDIVTLGDIAQPLGNIPSQSWNELKNIQLFAAPQIEGKAFQISKKKLEESLYYVLGESSQYLLLPDSLAIQKKGELLRELDIMRLVEKELHPQVAFLAQSEGRGELIDYRVPKYIFLPKKGQRIELEPIDLKAGRISLKFIVKELDNSEVKKYTGSVFLNLWKDLAVPIKPFNKGDLLNPDNITYVTKNIAHIRGDIWDGKGGPWQVNKAIGRDEVILTTDLSPLTAIRKGQLVKIQYKKGSINITQQGEAMQDGSLGDVINVRNTQSKKVVFGMIIDNQTILIQ